MDLRTPAATRFRTERKVEFQHCDPAGIVFYPRYFEMLNSAIEEWFDTRNGLPFDRMHGVERRGVPTARLSVVFTAPSRLGEVLDFEIEVRRVGGSSVELTTRCRGGGTLRFECEHTLVFIDLDSGRPKRWSNPLRDHLTAQIGAESTP